MAKFSRPTVSLAKFCVNAAFEHGLADGLDYEKRLFHSCFALADQKEGDAFIEKREPNFRAWAYTPRNRRTRVPGFCFVALRPGRPLLRLGVIARAREFDIGTR